MDFKYLGEIFPALMNGTLMTLNVFIVTLVISIPLGLMLAVILRSKIKILEAVIQAFIWLMRGTPLLLQLIVVFYGLPLIGLVFERYTAAIFAFTLNYAAYFAEIFRGGFASIDGGQVEAAKMLRFTKWQTLRYITLPQMLKNVVPALGNEVINLVKDSSLVYVIGLGDLLRAGNIAMARDVTLLPLVGVGLIYLLLIGLLMFSLKRLEQKFSYYR